MKSSRRRTPLGSLYLNASDMTPAHRTECAKFGVDREIAYREAHDRAAFLLDFLVSPGDLDSIRSLFGNQMVYMSPTANRRTTHPVARACHEFARADLFTEGTKHPRYIDVGGNILDTFGKHKHHTCLIATDARDAFRYLSQLDSNETQADLRLQIRNPDVVRNLYAAFNENDYFSQGSICLSGAEKCSHQSRFLVANHCLYDIPLENIWRIFQVHGADTMVSWTWYPPDLFWEHAGAINKHSQQFDFYRFRQVGDTSIMSFKDSSFSYIHNTQHWREKLLVNVVMGEDFHIVVEIQDQIGCMYKQRWCRVPAKSRVIRLEHTIWHEYLEDYVMVPDVFTYAQDHFVCPVQYIACPRAFYNRCINFGLKTMELRAETLHQFATSIITRIDIKDTVINDSFEIDPFTLDRVVYSFVFLCIVERNTRVEAFNEFVEEWKRTKNREIDTRWWLPFDGMIKKFVHNVSEWWCTRQAKRKLANRVEWYSALRQLKIEECKPISCNNAIRTRKFKPVVNTPVGPPVCIHQYPTQVHHPQIGSWMARTDNITEGIGDAVQSLRELFEENDHSSDVCENCEDVEMIETVNNDDFTNLLDRTRDYLNTYAGNTYDTATKTGHNRSQRIVAVESKIELYDVHLPTYTSSYAHFGDYAPKDFTEEIRLPVSTDRSPTVFPPGPAKAIDFKNRVGVPPLWVPDYPLGMAPRDCDDVLANDTKKYKQAEITAPSRNHNAKSRAAAKLSEVLKTCFKDACPIDNFLDIGAGPGHASTVYPTANNYHAIEYGIEVRDEYVSKYRTITRSDVRNVSTPPYASGQAINMVYSDIGPQQSFIDCADSVINLCYIGDLIIMKCFWPSEQYDTKKTILRIMGKITNIKVIKPRTSGEINREFYIYGVRRDQVVSRTDVGNFFGVLYRFEDERRAAVQAACTGCLVSQRIAITMSPLNHYNTHIDITRRECSQFESIFTCEAPPGIAVGVCKYEETSTPVSIFSGVPGCGKTTDIMARWVMQNDAFVIVPTKRLKEQYKELGAKRVHTFHRIFSAAVPRGSIIVIDEAFTFYAPYVTRIHNMLKPKMILLYGDPLQIGPIDFTSSQSYSTISRLAQIRPKIVNWVNHRNPQDVITILRTLGYHDMVGTNDVAASIYYVNGTAKDHEVLQTRYGRGPLIVYNQASAAAANTNTIHQYQGESQRTVFFEIDDRAIQTGLVQSIEHIRVMLSRHSEKLVFIGQNDHMRRYIDFIGSNIDINLQRFGIHLHDQHIPRDVLMLNAGTRPVKIPIKQIDRTVTFPACTLEQAMDIMDRTFKTNDFLSGIAGITDTNIAHEGGGRLIIKAEELMDRMRKMSAHGFRIADQKYAKMQFSDALTLIGSMSERYAKDTLRTSMQMAANDVATMLDALAEKMVRDVQDQVNVEIPTTDSFTNTVVSLLQPKTIKFLKTLRKQALTPGLFEYHLTEAFRSVDQKCMPRDEYDKLLESTKDFWVSFFPKKQVKAKMQTRSYDFHKVSQGVSAYNKQVNLLYAGFGRMLTHLLPSLLKNEIVMMCNMTDCEFSEKVGALMREFTDRKGRRPLERKAGDFSEYDSTQGLMAYMLMSVLYIIIGMPQDLVFRYRDHSDHWTMFSAFCKLIGELKFHSGTFETWLRNTIYNMCNIAIMYKWDDLAVGVFTGDDSGLIGHGVSFDYGSKWLSDHGLHLKNEEPPAIEFAGKFILSQAVVPDALRRVAKYLSKDYKDYHQYRETITSLRGGLEMFLSQSDLSEACIASNQYYNSTKLFDYVPTTAEMGMLYGFLMHEANNPRSLDQLVHFHKDILPVAQRPFKN